MKNFIGILPASAEKYFVDRGVLALLTMKVSSIHLRFL
jgi:hypothetical protein